ncbi:MAG: hypothetical protein MUC76_00580 [Spirochaetes bacterium]|jgi:hypothetical protein|nr:hypothetical protein [Spirochaetota bacterium]
MRKRKLGICVTYVCPDTVNTGMFEGSKMVAGTKMLSLYEVTAMVVVQNVSVKFLTPLTKLLLPIKAMDWLNATLGMDDSWKGGRPVILRHEGRIPGENTSPGDNGCRSGFFYPQLFRSRALRREGVFSFREGEGLGL